MGTVKGAHIGVPTYAPQPKGNKAMNADIVSLLDTIDAPFTDVPITDAEIAFADMCEAEQWTAANGIIYAELEACSI